MRQAHYLLGTVHPWDKDPSMKLLTDSKSAEHWIRPNTSTLVGLAMLRRWGPYDAEGRRRVARGSAREYMIPMMRYLVATHRTGDRTTSDGKPWGDAWQSAHWAYALGRAAWFVWDDLPADVQQGVRRVVAHEAGRFLEGHPSPRDEARHQGGRERLEQPDLLRGRAADARRYDAEAWEQAFVRWAISSYMRPSDAKNQQTRRRQAGCRLVHRRVHLRRLHLREPRVRAPGLHGLHRDHAQLPPGFSPDRAPRLRERWRGTPRACTRT